MTTPVLAPLEFYPPPVNPSPYGLFPAVNWRDEPGPTRFLAAGGVRVRPTNYGGETAFGAWDAPWCEDPGSTDTQLKDGERPLLPEPFTPFTLWAFDSCDPSPGSRAEVLERVQQNFRLLEPIAAEQMFAAVLLAGATVSVSRDTVREALAYLEGQLAKTNTVGQIHASPVAASLDFGLVLPSGGALRTPLGHQWVFGGGYVDTLGDLLVATSPVFGWRDAVQVRPVLDYMQNTYAAIAERSVVLGYEKLVGAVYVQDLGGGS